ncbi:hypothetical protein L245_36420 [Salmonella enterica subsp. enterica serovar Worthington str. BCH-4719]|nr:hypothetical protein L245_36420 [Salmonella enterica subsp. enterica serovar Worthington str. BCH-4719]
MSKNPHYRAGLMALSFALLPLAMLVSRPAGADELMKWERIPLQIPLKVGQERVVFVDKNVRVGFPPALNGKLRVQSTGGAVYLKADSAFPQTRVQLQDVESGEVLLFDIAAGEKGPTEPVRLVYSGDVSTLSHAAFHILQLHRVCGMWKAARFCCLISPPVKKGRLSRCGWSTAVMSAR